MIQTSRLRVAVNVVNLRHARDLTQAKLASISGLDRSYVGSIEQARRNVSIDNIDRLAQALGVDVRELFATIPERVNATPDGDAQEPSPSTRWSCDAENS